MTRPSRRGCTVRPRVVTADPATHEPLSNIQVFLIESALECVDWEADGASTRGLRRFRLGGRYRLTRPTGGER